MSHTQRKILSICYIYPRKLKYSFGEFLLYLTGELTKNKIYHVIALPYETERCDFSENNLKTLEKAGAEIKFIQMHSSEIMKTLELIRLCKEVSPSLIHLHYIYPPYSLFNLYAELKDLPLIYSERMTPAPKNPLRDAIRKQIYTTRSKIFNSKSIRKIVCVSNFVKEEHIKHYGVSDNKLITIYNGVNIERFKKYEGTRIRSEFGVRPDIPVITCVAEIRKGKGVENFIKASPFILEKIKNARFIIVGDGTLIQEIKKLIERLNLTEFFILTGQRNDVEKILSISSVLIVPTSSTWPEAFGFTAAEGLSVGVPVIASDIGGLKEIVEHGKTGYLVPPDDPSEIAMKTISILSNKVLSESFSENGIKRAKSYFSLDRMVQEHINLYLSVKNKM
ncbi:MAG: glycosyltransferase family 4 protein [Candidatus Methanoperedens sp.]|nr:glycosyltransferase family 4 protein [Candidatus Methanoperedens sp.]